MDICVVLFCVLWTLLPYAAYSRSCCSDSGSTSTTCSETEPVPGSAWKIECVKGNKKCAILTCHNNQPTNVVCILKDWENVWWSSQLQDCPLDTTLKPSTTLQPPKTTTTVAATTDSTTEKTITSGEVNTTEAQNATENNTTTATTQNNATTTTSETDETTTVTLTTAGSTNTVDIKSTSSATSTEHNVTSETGAASQDNSTVIYASVGAGLVIVIVVIVILVVFLMRRRRKSQKDESNGIKRQPHGAISNNSYHNAAMNDNTIPMNDLSRTSSENRYTDIYDDKPMVIDTFDDNYNTVALPNESKNEYGKIKPVAEPFVDNTYSHISNPNHLDMGTMYSHIGSALGHQQEKQPDFVGDTYAHIGQGNGNAAANGKNKQDTFVSDDTYSHIGKDATVPKTTKKTAEVDDTYSHLGQNVNQHPKMPPNADVDATYNTLGSSTNGVGTQNRPKQIGDDNDDASEYNHLEFGMKSATRQNQIPRKENNTKLPDKNTKQNAAASNLYAQVVKKKNGKFGVNTGSKATDKVKANAGNKQGQRNVFVVKDDDAKIAEETDYNPTDHQYFVLEKHERET